MYCANCGSQNNDGAKFCRECGAPLNAGAMEEHSAGTAAPEPAPQPQRQPAGRTAYAGGGEADRQYRPRRQPDGGENAAVAALKGIGSSGLFAAAAGMVTISAVFRVIASMSGGARLAGLARDFLQNTGLYSTLDASQVSAIENALQNMNSSGIGSALIAAIPSIFMILGLWLIFAEARKPDGERMGTAGLTIVQVIQVLGLICTILIGILCLAGLGIGAAAMAGIADSLRSYGGGDDSSAAIGVMIAAAVILLIIFIILIVFQVKILKMISGAKRTLRTGRALKRASMMVVVFLVIGGIGSVVGAVGSVATGGIFAMISGLCTGASTFLFVAIILKYKNAMEYLVDQGRY